MNFGNDPLHNNRIRRQNVNNNSIIQQRNQMMNNPRNPTHENNIDKLFTNNLTSNFQQQIDFLNNNQGKDVFNNRVDELNFQFKKNNNVRQMNNTNVNTRNRLSGTLVNNRENLRMNNNNSQQNIDGFGVNNTRKINQNTVQMGQRRNPMNQMGQRNHNFPPQMNPMNKRNMRQSHHINKLQTINHNRGPINSMRQVQSIGRNNPLSHMIPNRSYQTNTNQIKQNREHFQNMEPMNNFGQNNQRNNMLKQSQQHFLQQQREMNNNINVRQKQEMLRSNQQPIPNFTHDRNKLFHQDSNNINSNTKINKYKNVKKSSKGMSYLDYKNKINQIKNNGVGINNQRQPQHQLEKKENYNNQFNESGKPINNNPVSMDEGLGELPSENESFGRKLSKDEAAKLLKQSIERDNSIDIDMNQRKKELEQDIQINRSQGRVDFTKPLNQLDGGNNPFNGVNDTTI